VTIFHSQWPSIERRKGKQNVRFPHQQRSTINHVPIHQNYKKTSQFHDSNVLNFASAVAEGVKKLPTSNTTIQRKIIGKSDSLKLKAADPVKTIKAVYCISNVSTEFSVDDIVNHCKSLKVRVLFCYDVTLVTSSARAFKIAIAEADSVKMNNAEIWPRRIVIRPWRQGVTARHLFQGRWAMGLYNQLTLRLVNQPLFFLNSVLLRTHQLVYHRLLRPLVITSTSRTAAPLHMMHDR